MAVAFDLAVPFDVEDDDESGLVYADQWSAMAKWFDRGVGGVCPTGGQLAVSANGSGREVHVAAGELWLQGKFGRLDSAVTLPLSIAPGGGQERVDLVVARIEFTNRRVVLDVKAGGATTIGNGNSTVASLTTTGGSVYEQALARVLVTAGDVSITSDQVTDTRIFARNSGLKVGSVMWWPTSNAFPPGWLWADGSTFNRYTYSELYALYGTTTLPDLRGETLAGLDNFGSGAAGRLTGMTDVSAHYGEQKHVQTPTELAVHSHIMNHDHPNVIPQVQTGGSAPGHVAFQLAETTNTNGIIDIPAFEGYTSDVGANAAMNVMQPTHVGWWLIAARPT